MSISQSQQTRLGIFMVAGVVLLALFIIIPISFKLANKTKVYYSYFEGESLSGLGEGADVKFHGVLIGKVATISYNPDDLTRVKVVFRIKDSFPMKTDMFAQTGLMGITGLLYVEILGGSNESAFLKAGSEMPSKSSLMSAITGKAEVIINKVELLLNHLNLLTHPDSLASIKKILDNVEGVTATAKDFVDELSPNFKEIAAASKNTMFKVDTIASHVQSITGNINSNIDFGQFSRIMDQIDSTAFAMKNLSQNLDMTIKQSREDITVSMENLRETLENANELSKLLMENPSLILKGENQKQRRLQ
jgi:phospholipid/cholesterol/gamma-HCH transport system substrate-binding protein